MRPIAKNTPPATVTQTLMASTTDLSTGKRARNAFDQIDKSAARKHLALEQGYLCAFCMRRVNPEALDTQGEPTMKIAHRTPIDVAPAQALTWKNLLGSCDGGQRSGWRTRSCDAAQGPAPLTVDPTEKTSCAKLKYERRGTQVGLFITSDDPALEADVERTLGLNSGDLPELRQKVWDTFVTLQKKHAPKDYGRPARRAFLPIWKAKYGARLPEMLGVIEAKVV